ncbi:mandelate racemase/muconate lactonizing enzyme family protein [Planctomycetota bacterium]
MTAYRIQTSRRDLIRGMAGAGLALMTGGTAWGQDAPKEVSIERKVPRMKIIKAEPILTGGDIFLKIETDVGIVGYGDGTNYFLPYSVEGMLKDLIPYLIGEDPERVEYLWQVCFRRRFMRGGPSTGAAISAIDMALWDIKGKAYGVPVYQLLGGLARTKVRVYGHVGGNTAEVAARQAKRRVAKGITAIRFRAFHSYDDIDLHDHKLAVRQQIEYLAAIREAVGDDIDLILECHGRYDPEWAIKLAKLAEPYHPFIIEDPIRHENPKALALVRAKTSIPLAIGERYHNKWDFRETIVNSYVNYLRPDVCHCGGISEMKKIAAMGEVFYQSLILHNNAGALGTAAAMAGALSIPNVELLEAPWVNDDEDGGRGIVSPYPRVENGFAFPLEGPGLGVTFDESRARSRPFGKPGLQPRLNAPDGSVRDF